VPPRVAIVAGCRTPFAKAGTAYRDLTALDLAKACVRELLERTEIDPACVETLVMGQVVPSVKAPNLARETGLGAGLPVDVPAYNVNRACASSNQAIADVASAILLRQVEVGIAGGAESLSDVPILHSRGMARALVEASRARSLAGRIRPFARLRPRDLVPDAPAIAEPSTGLTMGQSAERMAQENGISREVQDHVAWQSHTRAAAAFDDGRLGPELCRVHVPPAYDAVEADNLIRRDATLEGLAALPPVFDRKHGTVTAGNSSPLTDGAAAVLLMSEERAAREGYEPLAFVRSWAVAAVDPAGQLLMGPRLAIPKALEKAGLSLADMDLVEMHEAFAAQVASNLQAVGGVDPEKLNVSGGSIALGHPFGATGARITTTLARELKRRGGRYGLLSVCAQGGMGFAMVLER
jgi:acetyl-CoA acyltransferase